jgi:hypothetical protein
VPRFWDGNPAGRSRFGPDLRHQANGFGTVGPRCAESLGPALSAGRATLRGLRRKARRNRLRRTALVWGSRSESYHDNPTGSVGISPRQYPEIPVGISLQVSVAISWQEPTTAANFKRLTDKGSGRQYPGSGK